MEWAYIMHGVLDEVSGFPSLLFSTGLLGSP